MNNLTINEQELSIKEYQGQRVVTFDDIDKVHGRPQGTASRNFRTNKEYFVENEDFFRLEASALKDFKQATNFVGCNANSLTLLTETGYLMLVKSFTDKLAWEVQRKLVAGYFRAKYEVKPQPQSLTRKTYKGKLVMTINDLSCITRVHRSTIRNVVKLQDHKLLKYREMMEYKKENKETLHGIKSLIIFGKDTALYVLSYFQYDDLKSTILNYFKEEPKKELPKPKDEPQKPVTYGEVELALKILSLMPDSDFKTKACQSLLYDVMGERIFQNVDFLVSVDKLIENIQSLTKDERIEEIESKEMRAFLESLSKRGCFLLERELNRVTLSE